MASEMWVQEHEADSDSAQTWRDVTHRLAGAVGLVRIVEEELDSLSDNVREIYEEGLHRLLSIVEVCARLQDPPTNDE